jgi:hypothetical protein
MVQKKIAFVEILKIGHYQTPENLIELRWETICLGSLIMFHLKNGLSDLCLYKILLNNHYPIQTP